MSVRRLVPADAPEYRALSLEAYAQYPHAFTATVSERSSLPLRWWEERMQEGDAPQQLVFGAFEEGRLAGMAGLNFEARPKTRHKATLFGMYVRPEVRQRGLGRALVETCLAHARAREGIRVVQLTVTDVNAPARALYERCGFVQFGLEPYAIAVDEGYLSKVHMWCAVGPLPGLGSR